MNPQELIQVGKFLQDHSQIEAARQFNVSKSYISVHFSQNKRGRSGITKTIKGNIVVDHTLKPDYGTMTTYRCQQDECYTLFTSSKVYSQVQCSKCSKFIYEE